MPRPISICRKYIITVYAKRFLSRDAASRKRHSTPCSQYFSSRNVISQIPLLSSTDNLRNGVSDNRSSLLRLFLCQPACNTDLERRSRLPPCIFGIESNAKREGFEPCNEDAVCETLNIVSRKKKLVTLSLCTPESIEIHDPGHQNIPRQQLP